MHGSNKSGEYNKTIDSSFKNYFRVGDRNLHWEDGFLDCLTAEDWERVCKIMTRDSDKPYNYLEQWGDQNNESSLEAFYTSDYFENSFDKALLNAEVRYLLEIGKVPDGSDVNSIVSDLFDKRSRWVQRLFDKEESQKSSSRS